MSLSTIKNKYIIEKILFLIPAKKRLPIIENSKKLNNKLDYLPLTYNKLFNFVKLKIDEFFKSEVIEVKLIKDEKDDSTIQKLSQKISSTFLNKNISINFKHLLDEILFDALESENVYYMTDSTLISKNKKLNNYGYKKNIIKFDDEFCKLIDNGFTFNNNEVYGISIKFKNTNIDNLNLINKLFKNIQYLELDFWGFFNNFDDTEIEPIFHSLILFAKNNPIKIFVFSDNTERTMKFIEQFRIFSKYLIYLDKLYFDKYFRNYLSESFIRNERENGNFDKISKLEDPNEIIRNYFKKFDNNNKITVLNMYVENPCDITARPEGGSFVNLATSSEKFNLIGKFNNLEEFVLSYPWEASYYYYFDSGKTLSRALSHLKNLKNVVFRRNIYLLSPLSLLNVEKASFISKEDYESDVYNYNQLILKTEMLNNIKNLEIKEGDECIYKNKILKFQFYEYRIDYFIAKSDNYPGMKNIEQLIIIVSEINLEKMEINKYSRIENLIKCTCNQKNNLQKIVIDYLRCDICKLIEILSDYCMSYNTLKNIELTGMVEPNDIDKVLDNIIKIKNQNVNIIIKIFDNNIQEIISNNEKKKNGLSFENIDKQYKTGYPKYENVLVKFVQIK